MTVQLWDRRRFAPHWLYWRLNRKHLLWRLVARKVKSAPTDAHYVAANDAVREACIQAAAHSRPPYRNNQRAQAVQYGKIMAELAERKS